jgi:hypothetical protein
MTDTETSARLKMAAISNERREDLSGCFTSLFPFAEFG